MSETNEEMERDFAEFRESQAMSARVSRTIAERMRTATPPTPDLDAVVARVRSDIEDADADPSGRIASCYVSDLEVLLAAVSRPAEARGEGARPDWEFPQMDDPDAQLVVMSFRDDHEWTAKVIHRQSRQFVTMADIQREYPAPTEREGARVEPPVPTDLIICEQWIEEIQHWVDETVPQPALALMLAALRNLEAARDSLLAFDHSDRKDDA